MSMTIDQLIRDLIQEDLFKAKYTSRQRSIFCENMYSKVYKFMEETNKEKNEKISELEEELATSQNDLEFYKNAYEQLKKSQQYSLFDWLYRLRLVIYVAYMFVVWKNYKDKEDISIKDIKRTIEIPYSIA
jgi:hypothetical protein